MKSLVFSLLLVLVAGCGPSLNKDGGYVLRYQVAREEKSPDLPALTRAVKRRLSIGGFKHARVRSEDRQVVVELPGADESDADSAQRVMQALGSLELRIVAAKGIDDDLIERAKSAESDNGSPKNSTIADNAEFYWVPVDPKIDHLEDADAVIRKIDGKEEVLLIVSPDDITSVDLKWVGKSLDEQLRYKIDAELNPDATERMFHLSGDNLKRHLAIVFDGEVVSAPVIQSRIESRLQITGEFEEGEVEQMVAVLSAGSLPARLDPEPLSVKEVQPR